MELTSINGFPETRMRLIEVPYERIQNAKMEELFDLAETVDIHEAEKLVQTEDLKERLILMKRKMEGSSHKWRHLFEFVKEEAQAKSDSLVELLKSVEATFSLCPVNSLSEVLRKEGYLASRNLQQEISKRLKKLIEKRSLVVIAGETNGGKSTFLNLLLGEDILPTDVLHCTIAVCKIVYSTEYSIKTLDQDDQVENFPCLSREAARELLKQKLAQPDMVARAHGSHIKEITLTMPADILKSGVTLVDTPGIGEDDNMDNVTMNFVMSTHASAFIYVIKSDTAGGVQEDRLLSFLRAIKKRYLTDSDAEAFDPRAAMFVCHRWDNIHQSQREKVKNNALSKLEYVWPGFEPSQMFFFSTADTMKHLPADPEFVTDSFMNLLQGLKNLFDRASHNAIKHQYIWLKYLLAPASHHLKSMIAYCNHSNEQLELYFENVVKKQSRLRDSSDENSTKLQNDLNDLKSELQRLIMSDLNFGNISILNELHESAKIVEECSKENFLYSKENRLHLDEMIIMCLLKYVDEHVRERNDVQEIESTMLTAIQRHLGLYESQIKQIKFAMQHGGSPAMLNRSASSLNMVESLALGSSVDSRLSLVSAGSSLDAFQPEVALDTPKLASVVENLLLERKNGKYKSSTKNSKHDFQESLLSRVKGRIRHGLLHRTDPSTYVEDRIRKLAKDVRDDPEVMGCIVSGYTEWIQQYVTYATESIPRFIDVNNKLMDEIRDHRDNFQRNKDLLTRVMEELEPCRHRLKGYGLLYMDDINTEMLTFDVEHRSSILFKDLVVEQSSIKDSGFQSISSKPKKVISLWSRMQEATILVDHVEERVVVKTYIYEMEERTMLSEIASLRILDNANVAPFRGMARLQTTDSSRGNKTSEQEPLPDRVSAFIFTGELVSARIYSSRKMTNMQLFVPDLFNSLVRGLNYIHREGLVHLELNFDTVMVEKQSGLVKLCQMCKPREARFPEEPSTLTRSCVCLSPYVLQGHVYESSDDIYAFGLLLWELLFPDDLPYKEQRLWRLTRFIEECNPRVMLEQPLQNLNVSEGTRRVLQETLLVSRKKNAGTRITKFESEVIDLSKEPAVARLRSRKEQIAFRRSSTQPDDQQKKQIQVQLVTQQKSPQRPPRKKDMEKSPPTEQEPEIDIEINLFPKRSKRRNTEPALVPYVPPANNKHKSVSNQVVEFFTRKHPKNKLSGNPHEKSSGSSMQDSDSDNAGDGHLARNPDKKNNRNKSVSSEDTPPRQSRVNHSGRRFSLQHQSLEGVAAVNLSRKDSFDVPNILLNLQRSQKSLKEETLGMSTNSLVQMDDQVRELGGSTKSDVTGLYYRKKSAEVPGSGFTLSELKRSRRLSPHVGNFFLDASNHSVNQRDHSIEPIKEDKGEGDVFPSHYYRSNALRPQLGGSLQNISSEDSTTRSRGASPEEHKSSYSSSNKANSRKSSTVFLKTSLSSSNLLPPSPLTHQAGGSWSRDSFSEVPDSEGYSSLSSSYSSSRRTSSEQSADAGGRDVAAQREPSHRTSFNSNSSQSRPPSDLPTDTRSINTDSIDGVSLRRKDWSRSLKANIEGTAWESDAAEPEAPSSTQSEPPDLPPIDLSKFSFDRPGNFDSDEDSEDYPGG